MAATPATNEGIAAALGHKAPPGFPPFRPTGNTVRDAKLAQQYLDDFEDKCQLYNIPDRHLAFRDVCGVSVKALLKKSPIPEADRGKTDWEKDLSIFKKKYLSQDLSIHHRSKFTSTKQTKHESCGSYIWRLTELVDMCKFSESKDKAEVEAANNRALIAQVAIGASNTKLREKALDQDSTWDDVTKLATKIDTRNDQISAMDETSGLVRKVFHRQRNYRGYSKPAQASFSKPAQASRQEDCRYCGNGQHGPKKCPAYGQKCAACGGANHLKPVCENSRRHSEKQIKHIEKESVMSETEASEQTASEYAYSSDSSYDTDDMSQCVIRHVSKHT